MLRFLTSKEGDSVGTDKSTGKHWGGEVNFWMAMYEPCGGRLCVWMEIKGDRFKEGFENQLESLGSEISLHLPNLFFRQNHLLKHNNVISLPYFSHVLLLLGEAQNSFLWSTDLFLVLWPLDHCSILSRGRLLPSCTWAYCFV